LESASPPIFFPGGNFVPEVDVHQATETYFPRIHRAALVLTGNPWDADDLAQETFLEFARLADRFEGRRSLYTWLYGILLNLERRHRRRGSIWRRKLRVLWDREPAPRTCPAAETKIEVKEWKTSLWAEVAKLPDGQRHSLVLRFSEHLSYEEVAEALDCPVGTIKSRIHHGLAALRDRLKNSDHEGPADVPPHAWEDLTNAV
ncbi:MAG: RNA polymerase sigma factor, partial [Planctomycetales bacterium]